MKSVDEYFVAGEVITEVAFGQSVVIIFFMVDMHMGIFFSLREKDCKGIKNFWIMQAVLQENIFCKIGIYNSK